MNLTLKELIKKMFPYIKPVWKQVFLAALCSLPLAAVKGYQAYLVKDIFDKGFGPTATQEDAYQLAILLFLLGVFNYPFRFYHFYGMKFGVERATCRIREQIFKKFQNLPVSFFIKNKQGELLARALDDSKLFSESFQYIIALIREPLTAIILLGVAFYHDWYLTLVMFAVTPLFIFVFSRTGRKVRGYSDTVQDFVAKMTHDIAEGLTGQKIIKAFNLQNYMVSRFGKTQEEYLLSKKKALVVEENAHPLTELIGALGFALVIVLAFERISSGVLTTGGFVSFVAALALVMDPIRKFSDANVKINRAQAAGNRIFNILKLENEEDLGVKELTELTSSVEFKNVSFSYGEKKVLKNLSFTLKKGESLGLAGLSGSGKSTVIALLLRLYNVDEGEILINGINIKEYTIKSVRHFFSLVSQDIFLFNDTVRENLVTGTDYDQDKLLKALKVSYADEFIEHLDKGLETHIGDRGLKLSGGQSQRLTIARAFLKNSPVMLFDEATSALDNESEKVVQAALDELAGTKTVLAVAHRLSTIQDYDKIIVLKDGEKVEEGAHEELMALGGEYHKFYTLSQRSEG